MENSNSKHFILVHGICHGAWCWYKVTPLLEAAGHRVTAVDLGASGAHPKKFNEVPTFSDYIQPLMELMASLPEEEKVVLVGHSFGGFSISFAMESFPKKVSAAVYLSAFMPNCVSPMSLQVDEGFKKNHIENDMDRQIWFDDGPEAPPTTVILGPKFNGTYLYQNCPIEDLELATKLVRRNGFYYTCLAKESPLTEKNFGSINRVFILCEEDKLLTKEIQEWIIEQSPTKEVKVVEGADHMAMLSKHKELCLCLLGIAKKYESN